MPDEAVEEIHTCPFEGCDVTYVSQWVLSLKYRSHTICVLDACHVVFSVMFCRYVNITFLITAVSVISSE
jgi:hypothetical protein